MEGGLPNTMAIDLCGPPVIVVNETGKSPFVLLCEHASRIIPRGYDSLGLPLAELDRHIAWDLGAAEVATRVACLLDAPLFLAGYSRLLIDLNRPPGSRTSIPEISEATPIPGNAGLSEAERLRRHELWFAPFHDRVAAHLDARRGHKTAVVGIHSFTPVYAGIARPWHGGILFDRAKLFGSRLTAALAGQCGDLVAENQPYQIDLEHDYTVPVHGDGRGLPAALVEIRQDLVSNVFGIEQWSRWVAAALQSVSDRVDS